MKIRLIDLLNKIANGEDAPKKIRFDGTYWERICGKKCVYYLNDNDNDLFVYIFRKNLTFTLNDEIEIIEEDKKIEKLGIYSIPLLEYENIHNIEDLYNLLEDVFKHFRSITNKLIENQNQLIDAVNELKKGE